jgi:phosphoglycolate phosphatase-like HAD superfamily hydrolase
MSRRPRRRASSTGSGPRASTPRPATIHELLLMLRGVADLAALVGDEGSDFDAAYAASMADTLEMQVELVVDFLRRLDLVTA